MSTWLDILPEEIIQLIYIKVYDSCISQLKRLSVESKHSYDDIRHLCHSQWNSVCPYNLCGEILMNKNGESDFVFYHELNNDKIAEYAFGPLVWPGSPLLKERGKLVNEKIITSPDKLCNLLKFMHWK